MKIGIRGSEVRSKHKDHTLAKKPLMNSLDIIREHRTAFLIGTIIPSFFGLFLGETLLAVQFNTLQPILASMAFLTVEIFAVFLIDFPMSVIAGCIIAKKTGIPQPRYGIIAGASYLTVFLMLIAFMGILHCFTTFFDVFGIFNAVTSAAQTAMQQFGFHLGVMGVMLLVFDYFLCMLGGILGFNIIQLLYPSHSNES